MHPSNRIRFSVVILAACSMFCGRTSDAVAQTKSSQDRGGRGILRNIAASLLNNSGCRPWIPDGRNRTVIVTSPSYVYSNEPSNLVFSPGAYDVNRPTQVNTPSSLAARYHPTPSAGSPVREQPITTYMNTTTLRPIGTAVGSAAPPLYPQAWSGPIAMPSRPVRDKRGFLRYGRELALDAAKSAGIAIGRGEIAFQQGRYEEARSEFCRAREWVKNDAIVCFNIGVSEFALGRYGRAAEAFHDGIVLSPPNEYLTYRLLPRYADPEELRAQRERLEARTIAHPDDAAALLVLTLVRWWSGDARGAMNALDQWENATENQSDATDRFSQTLRHWAGRAAAADPTAPK